jgi:cation-transporting ATPase 13A1
MENKILQFTYLKERSLFQRLDVFPFIFLQSISLVIYAQENTNHLIKIILFAILFLTQFITFFSKFWSESLMSKICFKKVETLDNATHIRVDLKYKKFKMNDRTSICPILKKPNSDFITIEFEKIFYYFDNDSNSFVKSKTDFKTRKIEEFLRTKPHSNPDEINLLKNKFGDNTMRIPIPSFFSLYKEHIVAPFFVFQLFCILLWVFDDYGIHSFFTLTMLCIFEATVVGQRIVNLITLRKMRVPPHLVYVYRNKNWQKLSSSTLLPGDIVSLLDGNRYETVEEKNEEGESDNLILRFLNKLKDLKKKAEEQRNQRSMNTVINRIKDKEPSPLTCDLILLSGSAIVNEAMLTGESVPQIKDSIYKMDHLYGKTFDPKVSHKNCILFAGTKVVKVTNEDTENLPENVHMSPPDRGAICMVYKIGFSTSQGKLLRTVMYSSDRAKGDSKEAFVFIFILLIVALVASYYVLIEGIEREGEITYKLLLRCIIIITSVVPAELPIELSLAINNSLFFLQGKRIVCIEPFRIPFAGKIDVCCFDKTGTLTKDEFIMRGVVKSFSEEAVSAISSDEDTAMVLLGCNSLLQISGKIVGDPVELAIFKSSGGKIENDVINSNRKVRILPIRRYAFDSNLKRMSVSARCFSGNKPNESYNRVLTKGAPEVIKSLLKSVPEFYDETYTQYAKQGYRILALAYGDDPLIPLTVNTKREEVEKNLNFCGFAIVETPLKNDTSKYIDELKSAEYEIAIITGDHHLTTVKVAQELKIGPNSVVFMKVGDSKGMVNETKQIKWFNLDGGLVSKASDVKEVAELSKKYTLGITGKEMELLEEIGIPEKHLIFSYIKLYCRVNPMQKDDIIKFMVKSGKNPSMCGDGSNDVGALKRAVIGIALLNSEETEAQKQQPFSILSLDDDSTIKSGDVTAAAPFTSKSGSIKCIKNIFIQGRCTLVITFQMFKILASNCLLSAYSLSVLALKGVKFSDYQSTYMGFVVAFFFLMLSKAEPLKKLNKNKPPFSIFSVASSISIVGQALTHLASLFIIIKLTEEYDPININTVKSLDDPFSPTLMNTIIFVYSALNQTINFVVNYQGEPFMKNMTDNKWLVRMVFGILALSSVVIFDLHPPLNEALELLPMPEDMTYRFSFIGVMLADFVICYLLENWKKLFKFYH